MSERKTLYLIGEEYRNKRTTTEGVAVIRPAVLEGLGNQARIITTAPCCVDRTRRLSLADITSDLAGRQGGWDEQCTHCRWRYKVTVEFTGQDPRRGLYGVRWTSKGF